MQAPLAAYGLLVLLLCSWLLRDELAAACALHLPCGGRAAPKSQGALGLLAQIKQRGFRILLPAGDAQPRLGVRLIYLDNTPSAPAALSCQLLFKQARFYISQTAAPAMGDQFLQDSELC